MFDGVSFNADSDIGETENGEESITGSGTGVIDKVIGDAKHGGDLNGGFSIGNLEETDDATQDDGAINEWELAVLEGSVRAESYY